MGDWRGWFRRWFGRKEETRPVAQDSPPQVPLPIDSTPPPTASEPTPLAVSIPSQPTAKETGPAAQGNPPQVSLPVDTTPSPTANEPTPLAVSIPSQPTAAETARIGGDMQISPVDSDSTATPIRPSTPAAPDKEAEDKVPIEWNVGDVILGLYEVKQVHTAGGMGLVYRVRHTAWDLELAVKSPRPEYFATERHKEDFVREAEAWVDLGLHPHIVSCFYVRTLGGVPRVFAEYMEGGSLRDWIKSRRLYKGGHQEALARILDVAIQFAWGLHYAHEKGVVHQDVKPGNVLMTSDGIAKVSDFGLARARSQAERAREEDAEILGLQGRPTAEQLGTLRATYGGMTPEYCSPEQARKEKLTRRTDLWSWGVSVLQMFMGGVSWLSGVAAPDVLECYRETGPEEDRLPRMPEAVAGLLARCFQDDPDARPHDMAVVSLELRVIYAEVVGMAYVREQPEAVKLLADALNNRAVSLIDLGRPGEGEKALEEALAADASHLHATYNHGLLLWHEGRMADDRVQTRLAQVCVNHKGAWEAPYLQAWIEMERGDEEAARARLAEAAMRAGENERGARQIAAAMKMVPRGSRCLRTLGGHTDAVCAVSITPDARLAVSGSTDKTLRVWEVATGLCLRTLQAHTDGVHAVSITPDARLAVSGSTDSTLRVWEVATGRCLRTLEGHRKDVRSVRLTPDGRLAVSWSLDETLRVWEVATGRCLRMVEVLSRPVCAVSITPDARLAVSGSTDSTLRVWEVATGRCLRTLEGHRKDVRSVRLTPDGRLAVSWSLDETLRIWEVATGRCLRTLDVHSEPVNAVSLTPDGRLAVSGSRDKMLRVWDVAAGRCARTLDGHTDSVLAVSLASDGRLAVSGSRDKTLRVWELTGGRGASHEAVYPQSVERAASGERDVREALAAASRALEAGEAFLALSHLATARRIAGHARTTEILAVTEQLARLTARGRLQGVWPLRTLEGHTADVYAVSVTPDGQLTVSRGSEETLRDWEVVTSSPQPPLEGDLARGDSVCLTTNGRLAVSGRGADVLWVWDMATGRCLRTLRGHTAPVGAASLTPDGRLAISGGADRVLRVWDVETGRCRRTLKGHDSPVASVSLTPDWRLAVSGSWDRTLRVWEVATVRCLRTLEGHTSAVQAVSLTPDGRLAVSGSWDKTLRVWEVATGRCLRTLEGHTGWVFAVSLTPDGRLAVSGSADKTLRVWDVATGCCVRTLEGHTSAVQAVSLTPNGRLAASRSEGKLLRVWYLDWELLPRDPADWDEDARPFLTTFLSCHTPVLDDGLTRRGRPAWTDADFQDLLLNLGYAGLGWLRPEGVRRELERKAASWEGPPPLV